MEGGDFSLSSSIDERVVEMRFDNRQFESGAQTSLSTLDKLKQSLNLLPAAEGLKSLGNVDISGMNTLGAATDTVKEKFSALQAIATGALLNIGAKAADLGMGLLNQVNPLKQVAAGWDGYAEKTSAVQTIMSATKNQFSETDDQMAIVSEQLDKLNWFTDETSYSFQDMVNNIGKFTSNGVKLEDAVTSMQGISTWAALSGANVGEASRAMYNLSQAMGVGAVKLQDWKSIENANMATVEFKQTAIETAESMGMLKKVGDGLWKTQNGLDVSVTNFNENLSKGAWFTKDVLTATLDRYGAFTNELNGFMELTGDYYDTTSQILSDLDTFKAGNAEEQLKLLSDISKDTGISVDDLRKSFEYLNGEEFELGRRAFKAAQEAKTFQEAIDSVKDAAKTAWMNIFEQIFGNYEQAKVLWTNLANGLWDVFVGPLSNGVDILKKWNELGGRIHLFGDENTKGAISELGDSIGQIFGAITSGFGEIDTDHLGIALANWTRGFRDFATNIKPSEGLISALSKVSEIAASALGKVGDVAKGAVGFIKDLAINVFNLVGRFADFIKNSERTEKLVTAIKNAIQNFGDQIDAVVAKVKLFGTLLKESPGFKAFSELLGRLKEQALEFGGGIIDRITGGFEKLSGLSIKGIQVRPMVDTLSDFLLKITEHSDGIVGVFTWFGDTIGSIVDKIKGIFSNFKIDTSGLDELGAKAEERLSPIKTLFEGVKAVFSGIWDFFKAIAPALSAAATKIGEGLKKLGSNVSDAIAEGDFSTVLDFVNSGALIGIAVGIANFIKKLSGVADEGTGIIGSIKDVFESLQSGIEKLTGGGNDASDKLKSIAIALAILTASVVALSLIDSDKLAMALMALTAELAELVNFTKQLDGTKVKGVAGSMIAMSVAVLLLSVAMKKIADLDWDGVLKGLTTIGALTFMLTKTAQTLSKQQGKMMKGATGLIAFALAIKLLVGPVKDLAALSWEELAKGLAGVGALCLEVAAFMKLTNSSSMGVGKGLGLVALAASIMILANAVEKFGSIPAEGIKQGLIAVGALLAEIGIFTKLTSGTKGFLTTSIGMIALAASMTIFAKAIESIGNLSLEQIGKGLLGMAGAMLIMAGAMRMMPVTTPIIAAGVLALAGAMKIIAGVMQDLGGMGWEEIARSLVTLAGAMTVLVVSVNLMRGAIGGAAAMLIIAGALAILSPVLQNLGEMSLAEIGKSLLMMAGAFTVLGVAAAVLGPLVPALLGLSGAVALFGVGALAAGAGMMMLGAGLTALAAGGTAAISLLSMAIMELINLLPNILVSIGSHVTEIVNTFSTLGLALIEAVGALVPPLVEQVVNIIDQLLQTIVSHGPSIVDSAIQIVMMLLEAIKTNIGPITSLVVDVILGLITGITDQIPKITQAGADLIIGLINGLSTAIETNAPRVKEAIVNLFNSLITAAKEILGINSPSTVFDDIGVNMIQGAINGIQSMAESIVGAIKGLMDSAIEGAREKASELWQVGVDAASGFVNGLKSTASNAWDAAKEMGANAWAATKDALNINSPSKLMAELGAFTAMGFAQGITDNTTMAEDAGANMAMSSFDAIKAAMTNADALLTDTLNPTITPVLDLSNVENGASLMNGMLNSNYMANVGANIGNVNPYGSNGTSQQVNNSNINYGGFNIEIYSQPGMDEQSLATMVAQQIYTEILSREAVVY